MAIFIAGRTLKHYRNYDISETAVHKGLVIAPHASGLVHCHVRFFGNTQVVQNRILKVGRRTVVCQNGKQNTPSSSTDSRVA